MCSSAVAIAVDRARYQDGERDTVASSNPISLPSLSPNARSPASLSSLPHHQPRLLERGAMRARERAHARARHVGRIQRIQISEKASATGRVQRRWGGAITGLDRIDPHVRRARDFTFSRADGSIELESSLRNATRPTRRRRPGPPAISGGDVPSRWHLLFFPLPSSDPCPAGRPLFAGASSFLPSRNLSHQLAVSSGVLAEAAGRLDVRRRWGSAATPPPRWWLWCSRSPAAPLQVLLCSVINSFLHLIHAC